MIKHCALLFFSLLLIFMPAAGEANPREEYETAYKIYIAAGASAAAYNDRAGTLASRYLQQDGWRIDHYIQPDGQNGMRFVLAQKEAGNAQPVYVLAIVGTETTGDVKMNLQVGKVFFAGTTVSEAASYAALEDIPSSEPKVHKGFNRFVQTGLEAVLRDPDNRSVSFPDLLEAVKTGKLLITGHSLGGAAATLIGARLLDAGAPPGHLEIITFGAPAVGNTAFAQKYEPQLNLIRVVMRGDPVTGALQTLVGGYRQFGREISWSNPPPGNDPHQLVGYIDLAIKNYYDKRHAAGITPLPAQTAAADKPADSVYIAPLHNQLPSALKNDFHYMREALWDEYRQTLPGCTFGADTADVKRQAQKLGFRWLIIPEARAIRLQQSQNTYYITLQQTVYDVRTGNVVDTAIFSTATSQLTPLEAFIHSFKGISANTDHWLKK